MAASVAVFLTGCASSDACPGASHCPDAVALCPSPVEPSFASLRSQVLGVSCGASGAACHSSGGAVDSGGLDLSTDPYSALLGSDGSGAPAANIAGSVTGLKRVIAGDPEHSFLVIKLSTKTGSDPRYGSGMPFGSPGALCAADLDQIRAWIQAGAKNN